MTHKTISKNKASITAALIVKNEEKHLDACLESVAWADEIIVLDSGSTDNTLEIAKKYNAKVFTNTEWQGFGAQRQLAQTYVETEWVFWIDADERVTSELKESILKTINNPGENTIYSAPRLSMVFGKYIKHCGWYPDPVIRLYRTDTTSYNSAKVHEKVIIPDGFELKELSGDLLHYTYDDLEHYLVKSASYASAWSEQKLEQGKTASLTQAVIHAFGCFIKMYFLKSGFLDGKHGFLLSALSSHSTFVKYADLWIKTKTRNHTDEKTN